MAAEIQEIMEGWVQSVRSKDAAAILSHVAPDVVMFDVVDPLRYQGANSVGKRMSEWLSSFEGRVDYENRDLNITAGGDVAFCHSLNRVRGTRKDGTKIEMWWRATVCFRKIAGKWMATHEHSSVPFDTGSGKASLHLKPE